MSIHPIRTEADYQAALERIEVLFDAAPDSPEADELDILTTLVEAYEEQHYAIPPADPIEAVLYFLESRGLTRQDLEPLIGDSARVAAVLNRQRPLTLRMIRRLHGELGIPAETLVKPYHLLRPKNAPKTARRAA